MQKELFRIRYGARHLSVAVRGRRRARVYIGYIDGTVCALARGKGDVMRLLLETVRDGPQARSSLV